MSGIGSSTQHPIASAAVSLAFGAAARSPRLNFAGDLGKAAIPAFTSPLLILLPWRQSLWALALVGLLVAVLIALLLPPVQVAPQKARKQTGTTTGARGGFALLFAIGVLDTGVRMGLLTFLPFLLKAKGAPLPLIGLAFALVFIGGAAGKFVCG